MGEGLFMEIETDTSLEILTMRKKRIKWMFVSINEPFYMQLKDEAFHLRYEIT